jgi:C-8 sterol isomerase
MFDALRDALDRAYPGHIHRSEEWQISHAGGAMGLVNLVHASFTEYLLLFGSPMATSGHSGRHRCEVHQFVLDGELWCYDEGEHDRRVLKAGDHTLLRPSVARGYCIPDHAWMLEYGRGLIPSMMPFALAGSMFVSLDARGLGRSILRYGAITARELLRGKL